MLAVALSAYALGITAIQVSVGHLALPLTVGIAMAAGVFNPAVAGGWTSQLPNIVTGDELSRASALDALTFGAASLTGPALIAAWAGARAAVLTAAILVALAVPAACALSRSSLPARHNVPDALHRRVRRCVTRLVMVRLHWQAEPCALMIVGCRAVSASTAGAGPCPWPRGEPSARAQHADPVIGPVRSSAAQRLGAGPPRLISESHKDRIKTS
jgi:hypothetical protein